MEMKSAKCDGDEDVQDEAISKKSACNLESSALVVVHVTN